MEPAVDPPQKGSDQPALLLELEPWRRVFFQNLRDLVPPAVQTDLQISSSPGQFWPDVFVDSGLAWRPFSQSAGFHIAAIALILGLGGLWPHGRQHTIPTHAPQTIVYYSPSEYLPQLDTGLHQKRIKQKGQPEYARQSILSVPSEPDNRTQTIITPPEIKLKREVLLPNIVAWSQAQPLVPIATTERISTNLRLPAMPIAVVAPVPVVTRDLAHTAPGLTQEVVAPAPKLDVGASARSMAPPTPAVISPAPYLQAVSARRVGDINIPPSHVVAPAPTLPLAAQRTLGGSAGAAVGKLGSAIVAPPPSILGPNSPGRLIALGIHPSSLTPSGIAAEGNRRANFAVGPTGKIGAGGTPDTVGGEERGAGSGPAMAGIPAGISVGAAPGAQASSVASNASGNAQDGQGSHAKNNDSRLIADAQPPDVSAALRKPSEVSDDRASDLDRKVFGERKSYSMSLNMPNLNSAAGSWIIRFAELKQDEKKGDLTAPVATQKVDPAYPTELMRHNVHGTVTLRAIIRSDGSVAEVSVLRGIDDRLDQYACTALSHWRFVPATKNGSAVDLEAVVIIPFRATRTRSGF
jgi:TonB family protein